LGDCEGLGMGEARDIESDDGQGRGLGQARRHTYTLTCPCQRLPYEIPMSKSYYAQLLLGKRTQRRIASYLAETLAPHRRASPVTGDGRVFVLSATNSRTTSTHPCLVPKSTMEKFPSGRILTVNVSQLTPWSPNLTTATRRAIYHIVPADSLESGVKTT
jgi:hypothetical protein